MQNPVCPLRNRIDCTCPVAQLRSRWCNERYNGSLNHSTLSHLYTKRMDIITHQSSGFGGGLSGTGSVEVNCTHNERQIAGWRTSKCHFLHTCFKYDEYMRSLERHNIPFRRLVVRQHLGYSGHESLRLPVGCQRYRRSKLRTSPTCVSLL